MEITGIPSNVDLHIRPSNKQDRYGNRWANTAVEIVHERIMIEGRISDSPI